MIAEATSGADIAQSGAAAVLFGALLYPVLRYLAQPWVYFSRPDEAKPLFMAVPVLFVAGGLIAVVVGLVKEHLGRGCAQSRVCAVPERF